MPASLCRRSALPVLELERTRVPCRVSVFDVLSLRTRVVTSGAIAPAVAASCAVPLLFAPTVLDGRPCFDGGLGDCDAFAGCVPGERVLRCGQTQGFPTRLTREPSGAHAGAQRLTRCACTLARARACSPCGRACPHSIQHENKAHVAIDADASRPAGEPAQRPASARPLTLVDRLMRTLLSRHEPPKGVANAAGAERAAYLGHAPRSLLLGVSPTAPRVGLTEAS